MITGSFAEHKFWNKRASGSEFLITAPNSLDNYFRSQQTRIKGGHLPMPVEFNEIQSHESIECVVGKKLRGVKLSEYSQKVMELQLKLIDKNSYDIYYIKLEMLLAYYLEPKKDELTKAIYSGRLNEAIVKPFIRIYLAIYNKEYAIDARQYKIKESFQTLFKQILRDTHLITQNSQQNVEKTYRSCRNTNSNIIQKADQILLAAEQSVMKECKNIDEEKFKIRDLRACPKPETRKTRKQLPEPTQKQNNRIKTNNKIKFKSLNTEENQNAKDLDEDDCNNLCYELGLLIEDTDRILKTNQQVDQGLRNSIDMMKI